MPNDMWVARSRALIAAGSEDAAVPVRCLRLSLGLGALLPGPGPPREQLELAHQLAAVPDRLIDVDRRTRMSPKPAKPTSKPSKATAKAAKPTSRARSAPAQPSHEEIARRAHEISQTDPTDDAVSDWLKAEQELTQRPRSARTRAR